MAPFSAGREHLVTLALPLDVTVAAAIAQAVDDAMTGLGWSDVRLHGGTHAVTAVPPAAPVTEETTDE